MRLKYLQKNRILEPTIFVNKRFLFVTIVINILPLFINFCWILILHEYRSEFPKKVITVGLSNLYITLLFFFNIVLYVLLIQTFFLIQKKRLVISQKINVYFSRYKLELFLLVIILAKLFFQLKTGVGKAAGEWQHNKFSVIFNFFNIDTLFIIYYLSYRTNINKKFIIIVIAFSALQILSGWTGFILNLVLLEIFCNINSKQVIKYLLLLPLIFFIGALAYQFMYPLKMFIRLGVYETITYGEALIKLIERLSWFSHACVGIQNSDEIVKLYRNYSYSGTEIKAFFRPFTPSFLFPNKDFRSVNNLLMNSVYPDLKGTTSSNFGQLAYLYNLIKISSRDFLYYFVVLIINSFLYKFFMDMCSPNKKEKRSFSSNYIIFGYFGSIFSVGSLENISYGWVSIIWTYVFLFFVGIIKVGKK